MAPRAKLHVLALFFGRRLPVCWGAKGEGGEGVRRGAARRVYKWGQMAGQDVRDLLQWVHFLPGGGPRGVAEVNQAVRDRESEGGRERKRRSVFYHAATCEKSSWGKITAAPGEWRRGPERYISPCSLSRRQIKRSAWQRFHLCLKLILYDWALMAPPPPFTLLPADNAPLFLSNFVSN